MTTPVINSSSGHIENSTVTASTTKPVKKEVFIEKINSLIFKALEHENGKEKKQLAARANFLKCAIQHKIPKDKLKEVVTELDQKIFGTAHSSEGDGGEPKTRSEKLNTFIDDSYKNYEKKASNTKMWRVVGLVAGVALFALGLGLTASGVAAGAGVPLLTAGLFMILGFVYKLRNSRAKKFETSTTDVKHNRWIAEMKSRIQAKHNLKNNEVMKLQKQVEELKTMIQAQPGGKTSKPEGIQGQDSTHQEKTDSE